MNKFTIDQCAFGSLAQKPTDLWTSLTNFRPVGNTGDGRCHERCGRGYFTASGAYHHVQAYAQEPHRQPTVADQASTSSMLLEEILGAAFDGSQTKQNGPPAKPRAVIDLYCGSQRMAPVAIAMGMQYIGVNMNGRPIPAT